MGLYIKGMELPKYNARIIYIVPDGTVFSYPDGVPIGKAVEVPPHGDLIEVEHLKETLDYYIREAGWGDEINKALRWVKDEFIESEPVIIPAEREGET